jgi:hypothetical protein
VIAGANLVQAEDLAGRVVELVMVDLDMGEGGVELDVDVALPGRESERGHGGDGDDAGVVMGVVMEAKRGAEREEGGRVTTAGIVQQKHVDGLVSGSQVMSGRDVARDV